MTPSRWRAMKPNVIRRRLRTFSAGEAEVDAIATVSSISSSISCSWIAKRRSSFLRTWWYRLGFWIPSAVAIWVIVAAW